MEKKKMINLEEWISRLYIDNAIMIIFDIIALAFLFFILSGGKKEIELDSVMIFIFKIISVITITIPIELLVNSRLAFIRNKWSHESGKQPIPHKQVKSPINYLIPELLLISLGSALLIYFFLIKSGIAQWLSSKGNHAVVIAMVFSYFIILILTSLIIKRHFKKDFLNFSYQMTASEKYSEESMLRYFFRDHIIYWIPILTILLMAFGLKKILDLHQISDLNAFAEVEAVDIACSSLVIALWVFYFSQKQIRIDYHLGRIKETSKISSYLKLILYFGGLFLAIGIIVYFLIMTIKINSIISSPLFLILLHVIVPMLAGFLGCYIGICWGYTRESKMHPLINTGQG